MAASRLILHVDDDPQVTSLFAKRIEPRGYEMMALNDPRAAITTMVERRPSLVLLDIEMPYKTGLQVLREIKAHDGGLQVIMVTGLVSMTVALESYRSGAEACFFKPIRDFEPLLTVIDETFRKIDRWWETLQAISHARRQLASV